MCGCRSLGAQTAPAREIPGLPLHARDGELPERLLEARVWLAGVRAAGAVVEEHADLRKLVESRQAARVCGLELDRIERHGHPVDPHRLLVDHRPHGLDLRGVGYRRLLGHK